MIQIRKNVFETNSSSTHSMVIGKKDLIDQFIKGDLFYIGDAYGLPEAIEKRYKDFISKKDLLKEIDEFIKENPDLKAECFNEDTNTFDEDDLRDYLKSEYDIQDYDNFGGEYTEKDHSSYTTEHGDDIGIVCAFGYDG